MSANADLPNRKAVPSTSPPPNTTSPQQTMPAGNAQPWIYTAQPTGEKHFKQPRYTPSKVYLVFDILAKFLAAASLLGILVVMAMALTELKSIRGELFDLSIALNGVERAMGTISRVEILSSSINPMWIRAVGN